VAQVVENLPSKGEALSSNVILPKNKEVFDLIFLLDHKTRLFHIE
jgi:hypothetical protein